MEFEREGERERAPETYRQSHPNSGVLPVFPMRPGDSFQPDAANPSLGPFTIETEAVETINYVHIETFSAHTLLILAFCF